MTRPVRLAINGAAGRMGRALQDLLDEGGEGGALVGQLAQVVEEALL